MDSKAATARNQSQSGPKDFSHREQEKEYDYHTDQGTVQHEVA